MRDRLPSGVQVRQQREVAGDVEQPRNDAADPDPGTFASRTLANNPIEK